MVATQHETHQQSTELRKSESRIPAEWQKWPEDKRPPLVEMPSGKVGVALLASDGDGSIFPEDFPAEIFGQYLAQGYSYEQLIRTPEALAGGQQVVEALQLIRLNGGVPTMNWVTGRACPEMRSIARTLGDEDNSSFVIGGDGSDFDPPDWLRERITPEKRQALIDIGFTPVTIQNGRELFTYSDIKNTDILAMLQQFQTEAGVSFATSLDDLGMVAEIINQRIVHTTDGDNTISAESCMRGGSAYAVIENPQVVQAITEYAQHYGIRVVPSPHVSSVIEFHGAHVGKETAFIGLVNFMKVMLNDPDNQDEEMPFEITFGGNRGNDVKAAHLLHALRTGDLQQLSPHILEQHGHTISALIKQGAITGRTLFFPRMTDGELFVRQDELPPDVIIAPSAAAHGWAQEIGELLKDIQTRDPFSTMQQEYVN